MSTLDINSELQLLPSQLNSVANILSSVAQLFTSLPPTLIIVNKDLTDTFKSINSSLSTIESKINKDTKTVNHTLIHDIENELGILEYDAKKQILKFKKLIKQEINKLKLTIKPKKAKTQILDSNTSVPVSTAVKIEDKLTTVAETVKSDVVNAVTSPTAVKVEDKITTVAESVKSDVVNAFSSPTTVKVEDKLTTVAETVKDDVVSAVTSPTAVKVEDKITTVAETVKSDVVSALTSPTAVKKVLPEIPVKSAKFIKSLSTDSKTSLCATSPTLSKVSKHKNEESSLGNLLHRFTNVLHHSKKTSIQHQRGIVDSMSNKIFDIVEKHQDTTSIWLSKIVREVYPTIPEELLTPLIKTSLKIYYDNRENISQFIAEVLTILHSTDHKKLHKELTNLSSFNGYKEIVAEKTVTQEISKEDFHSFVQNIMSLYTILKK
jgi:hypothetical protein